MQHEDRSSLEIRNLKDMFQNSAHPGQGSEDETKYR